MTRTKLGPRLKALRQQKGLTLRSLAKLAGCSASFISQIELNRASPTLANLEKISIALKMPLADILREEPPLREPVRVPLAAAESSLAMCWHRARLHHLLPADIPNNFSALHLTIDVEGETPVRASPRSTNELAIVLVGNVELYVNGKAFALEAHEAIYFDLSISHCWRNVGSTAAEIVSVHAPVFRLFEQEEENLIWSRRKDGMRLFR